MLDVICYDIGSERQFFEITGQHVIIVLNYSSALEHAYVFIKISRNLVFKF